MIYVASVRRKKADLSDWTGEGGDGNGAKMEGPTAEVAGRPWKETCADNRRRFEAQ